MESSDVEGCCRISALLNVEPDVERFRAREALAAAQYALARDALARGATGPPRPMGAPLSLKKNLCGSRYLRNPSLNICALKGVVLGDQEAAYELAESAECSEGPMVPKSPASASSTKLLILAPDVERVHARDALARAQSLGPRPLGAPMNVKKDLRATKCLSSPCLSISAQTLSCFARPQPQALNISADRRRNHLDVAFRDQERNFSRYARTDGFAQAEGLTLFVGHADNLPGQGLERYNCCLPSRLAETEDISIAGRHAKPDPKNFGTLHQARVRRTQSNPGLVKLASLNQDLMTRPFPCDKREMLIAIKSYES